MSLLVLLVEQVVLCGGGLGTEISIGVALDNLWRRC
jgi:hypothetical protein